MTKPVLNASALDAMCFAAEARLDEAGLDEAPGLLRTAVKGEAA